LRNDTFGTTAKSAKPWYSAKPKTLESHAGKEERILEREDPMTMFKKKKKSTEAETEAKTVAKTKTGTESRFYK
jgi:hypothetical protein